MWFCKITRKAIRKVQEFIERFLRNVLKRFTIIRWAQVAVIYDIESDHSMRSRYFFREVCGIFSDKAKKGL